MLSTFLGETTLVRTLALQSLCCTFKQLTLEILLLFAEGSRAMDCSANSEGVLSEALLGSWCLSEALQERNRRA